MDLKLIAPKRTERGTLVGSTGSGKTTLAKCLLPLYQHVLAVDPKITLGSSPGRLSGHLEGFALVRRPADLAKAAKKATHLQYRPDPEFQNLEDYDRVYAWVFDRRDTFVYTDEVYLIMEGSRIPDSFRACVTSGRERGIGMLHATQRPTGIDLRILSESEHFYAFQLRNDDDRKRMSMLMGPEVRERPASGHDFWYAGPRGKARLLRLRGVG